MEIQWREKNGLDQDTAKKKGKGMWTSKKKETSLH